MCVLSLKQEPTGLPVRESCNCSSTLHVLFHYSPFPSLFILGDSFTKLRVLIVPPSLHCSLSHSLTSYFGLVMVSLAATVADVGIARATVFHQNTKTSMEHSSPGPLQYISTPTFSLPLCPPTPPFSDSVTFSPTLRFEPHENTKNSN